MALNSGQRQLIAVAEGTRGTYQAPVPASDFDVIVLELGDIARDFGHDGGAPTADGTFITSESYSGKKMATVDFMTDLAWSGDELVAPKWWKFPEACGMFSTVDAVNPAKIEWSGKPSCGTLSMVFNQFECGQDPTGIQDVMAGCAGNMSISVDAVGSVIRPSFSFSGKYGGTADLAQGSFTAPSGTDGTLSDVFLGASVTIGSDIYKVYAWSFDMQNDVQSEDDNADTTNGVATGIDFFAIKNSSPQLTITAVRVAKTERDNVADTINNVKYATGVIETTHHTMTFAGVQPIDDQLGNTNETATEELTLKVDTFVIEQKA